MERKFSIAVGAVLVLVGLGIGVSAAEGGFMPSEAFVKLSVYRSSETASLHYAAKHFWDIYGAQPVKQGRMQAVRPVLGLPSFVGRGTTLTVEYLADVTGVPALRMAGGPRYQLSPLGKLCPGAECVALGASQVVLMRRLEGSIMHVKVKVAVPATVPVGFYDLWHNIPLVEGPSSSPKPASSQAVVVRPTVPVATRYRSWRSPSAVQVLLQRPGQLKTFTFIHFTDPHLRADVGPRLHLAVDWINKLNPRPDFVAITGDLVEYGAEQPMWKLMRKEVRRLQLPTVITLGNHDYYRWRSGQTDPPPGVLKEEVGLRNYFRFFHPFLAYRFAYGGYRFLAVDTGSSATSSTWWRMKWVTTQGLGGGQLKDIEQFLKTPARNGHVLLGHSPTRARLSETSDGCYPGLHGSFIIGRGRLEDMMRSSYSQRPRPIIYLHGHTHWNDLFVRSEQAECRFIRFQIRNQMMGAVPCWRALPMALSPLLIGTQSGTKHQPLRSGGWHQRGMQLGEGAGAGFGFRALRVNGRHWDSASFRFYHRTRVWARRYPDGYIDPASSLLKAFARCSW